MASESTWASLHPGSIVVNLVPAAWRLARNGWPIFLLAWFQGSQVLTALAADAGLLVLFFGLSVGATFKHWATLRYRVHQQRLEIRTGLLFRQLRTIDAARIQHIERIANVFHKATGLVEVRIETASGTEVEGLLSALTVGDAERLRTTLEHARGGPLTHPTSAHPSALVANTVTDLAKHGTTALQWGWAVVALGMVFEILTAANPSSFPTVTTRLSSTPGVLAGVAMVSGVWLVSVFASISRYYGFQLFAQADSLVVQHGLFTKRRFELPRSKVQRVTIDEPLFRRVLGFGSVTIETAAAHSGEGGLERLAATIPVVEASAVPALVAAILPQADIDLVHPSLRPAHPRTAVLIALRAGAQAIALSVVGWGVVGTLGLFLGTLALPAWAIAWFDYRHQGYAISNRVVLTRRGYLHRTRTMLSRSKIQSVEAIQGVVLRQLGLGTVLVWVAGSAIRLPLMTWQDALAIATSISQETP